MSQSSEDRFRQVSLATMDAKLYGAGILMIMEDNSFKHIPIEAVRIDMGKMEKARDNSGFKDNSQSSEDADSSTRAHDDTATQARGSDSA